MPTCHQRLTVSLRTPDRAAPSSEALAPGIVASEASQAAERERYLRLNVVRAVGSILAIFGCVAAAGILFETELFEFTRWVYETIGIGGLAVLLFSADAITTPVPPDLILLVIAKTDLALKWYWWVPLGGTLSAVAGIVGWGLGRSLGGHRTVAPLLARFNARHGSRIERYGRLTVALGALTPLPFSITCWSAGAVGMTLRTFAPLSLLRLPRYVFFYAVIVYSDQLARSLF